tara:strand:- start:159 stop:635 length:477 start_codon:yes stop_codon:yes gene_type:complete
MKEIFKNIPNHEGYKISNLGNIRSFKGQKDVILKGGTDAMGYKNVCLYNNGKKTTYTFHKLVAITFLNHKPKGSKGLCVDHKNGIKKDNRLVNLQLITQRLNLSKDKKGSSKYTGVSWQKSTNKWMSGIYINGQKKHLGLFNCEIEASKEYQKALANL